MNLTDDGRHWILKYNHVLTCSSFIVRGRFCDLPAILSKLSTCLCEIPTSLSLLSISPPGNRAIPSTSRQLLSAEAGRGANSDTNESSGSCGKDPTAEVGQKESAKSEQGLRITPALVLLGIHLAKKSAWEN